MVALAKISCWLFSSEGCKRPQIPNTWNSLVLRVLSGKRFWSIMRQNPVIVDIIELVWLVCICSPPHALVPFTDTVGPWCNLMMPTLRLRVSSLCHHVATLSAILILAAAVPADSTAQPTSPDDAKPSTEQLAALVQQLDADSFADREGAMQELIQMGQPALESIQPLTRHKNRELRKRAEAIVIQVALNSRPERLRRFVAGEELTGAMAIPGWHRMTRVAGANAAARQLWISVLQSEWEFLNRFDKAGAGADQVLLDRLVELNSNRSWKQQKISRDAVIALMVSATTARDLPNRNALDSTPDHVGIQIYSLLSQLSSNGDDSAWQSPVFRKIVGRFIVAAQGPTSIYQGLTLAMRQNLEQEGLEAAERVIRSGGGLPHVRQYAILALARFGGKEHVATLQDLLDDSGVFYTGKLNGNKRAKIECQVRDLALASLIHLTGGDPRAAGFQHLQANKDFVFLPHTVGFTSEDDRLATLSQFQVETTASTLAPELGNDIDLAIPESL